MHRRARLTWHLKALTPVIQITVWTHKAVPLPLRLSVRVRTTIVLMCISRVSDVPPTASGQHWITGIAVLYPAAHNNAY
jgi:hypothetical protein